MKRIQKAYLTQTVIFSNHNGETTAYARKLIEEEYKKYIKKLDVSRTKYQLLSEHKNNDGSIVIEIKKQYNNSPVGDYLNQV